ncbi:hypothetical protein ABK040_013961 [Willaertia magna]
MSATNKRTQIVYRLRQSGLDNLVFSENEMIPSLKRGQVLVKIKAASLNFRDILILTGKYSGINFREEEGGLIPLSDGAGEVVEIGEDVKEFKVGDKVCGTFYQEWQSGDLKPEYFTNVLGGSTHGVLAQYRVFEANGLIKIPSNLSFEEAATLPCAALTAWHALTHNGIQSVGPNQTVLILGTGGVSVFGIQFAKAAGARVIVTSSSDEKLEKAKQLGATDVINYSKHSNWHEQVRQLTDGKGVDHVLEVGGKGTLEQSIKSVRIGGQVHMIGVLTAGSTSDFDVGTGVLFSSAILKGVLVGSKAVFESMNKAIEINNIHPVIDKVFGFNQTKEAFQHLLSQQHVGKIVIRVD